MLAAAALTHRYQPTASAALDGVTLSVAAGERVAIIGESGSGKSTLLMALAGLLTPSSGAVTLDGTPVSAIAPPDRRLALVFQTPPAMPGMRVRDLLLRPARRDRTKDPALKVEAALKAMEIQDLADRSLAELSGGERQRAFLARTLVWQPRLMLLDEPFSNVDVRTKRSIIPRLLQHQAASAAAMVLITHDAQEAMLVADRYLLLHRGKVASTGETATAAAESPSTFSALVFRGSTSNLLAARHLTNGSTRALDLLGTRLPGHYAGEAADGPCVVLVSPDRLRLGPTDAGWTPLSGAPDLAWSSAQGGALAVALHDGEPIYALGAPLAGGRLAIAQGGYPVFSKETGLRTGVFTVV